MASSMKGLITSTRLTPGLREPKGPAAEAVRETGDTTEERREVGEQWRRVAVETKAPAEEPEGGRGGVRSEEG